jgi:hypothetical protein
MRAGAILPLALAALTGLLSCSVRAGEPPAARLRITGVKPGARVSRPVTVGVTVTGKADVVGYYVNDKPVKITNVPPFTWTLVPSAVLNGSDEERVTLRAQAYGPDGRVASAEIKLVLVKPDAGTEQAKPGKLRVRGIADHERLTRPVLLKVDTSGAADLIRIEINGVTATLAHGEASRWTLVPSEWLMGDQEQVVTLTVRAFRSGQEVASADFRLVLAQPRNDPDR